MAEQKAEGPVEGGFVECLFEIWKLSSKIIRGRADIRVTGQSPTFTHRFISLRNRWAHVFWGCRKF
jgi:hypothetical protein